MTQVKQKVNQKAVVMPSDVLFISCLLNTDDAAEE